MTEVARDVTDARLRIVVVDDDPTTLDVLELALTLDGHEVVQASDGAAGLDLVRDTRPDLVIVDWMMPVMDGIAMTQQLRAERRLARLPIVMLTARTMPSNVWSGLQAGVDAYITKPIDVDEVRTEIDRLCYSPSSAAPAVPRVPPGPSFGARARAEWVAAVSDAITAHRVGLLDVATAGKLPPAMLSRVLAGTHWPRLDSILAVSSLLDIPLPDASISGGDRTVADGHHHDHGPDVRPA